MLTHASEAIRAICAAAISSPAPAATSSSSSAMPLWASTSSRRARRPDHRGDAQAASYRGPRMPLRHEHRHRRRTGAAVDRASACSSTPISRSIGPKAAAATAANSSPRRCRPRSCATSRSPTRSWRGSSAASSSLSTSRSSTRRPRDRRASRRWSRWQHPTRGIFPPAEFIVDRRGTQRGRRDRPRDPRTGARGTSTAGGDLGLDIPRFSVNVSLRRLRDEGCCRPRKLDIPPGTLSFELVKSIYLDESDDELSPEYRPDQGARHRHRNRRFRHRLCLDRQPDQAASRAG